MPLILQIQTGSRAGHKVDFTKSVVIVGRHPEADLRFDVNADIDVSSRHAEFRSTDSGWSVLDLGSTNGTWVNGERISAAKTIRAGDKILLGAKGPRLEVLSTGSASDLAPPPKTRTVAAQGRPNTEQRVAAAVAAQTGHLKKFVIGMSLIVVAGVGVIVYLNQKEAAQSRRAIEALLHQSDSLRTELQNRVADAEARAAGFDSLARKLRDERDVLTKALQAGGDVSQLTTQIGALDRRTSKALSLTPAQILAKSGKAVAFIVVAAADGKNYGGTAFGVTPGGLFVTNKHVLMEDNQRPKNIAVYLADTDAPLYAHFVSAAADADLAFLQLDKPGTYPTVFGVGSSAKIAAGDPVLVVGFPSEQNPQPGVKKKTTTTYGAVSKLDTLVQINAYAAQGSSGSPVFDSRGFVIGVLVGGEGGNSSVLTWIVQSDKLIDALPPEAKGIVRK